MDEGNSVLSAYRVILILCYLQRLTENLLLHGDYNVIIVNWGGGSLPMYSQATANTRVVGLEIAYMVNTMIVIGKRSYFVSKLIIMYGLNRSISELMQPMST